MSKKERTLTDKEHRSQFLEANAVNYLLLNYLEAKYKPEGNLLRGIQNAKAITATTLDKLTEDYPDLKNSVDMMLTTLDHEMHKCLGEVADEQK